MQDCFPFWENFYQFSFVHGLLVFLHNDSSEIHFELKTLSKVICCQCHHAGKMHGSTVCDGSVPGTRPCTRKPITQLYMEITVSYINISQ